ncbi:PaaI family thioesterase [Streptomyces sp. SID5785]|uniref:PaaI family thioesterase n=1 Tax=Streptomyces sp. SID5785 TaxID=2690309 RepID=UPI0013612239|nr:PaaI family thioesterase [Streptomyces sp. SID5785]MZD04072.1 PaaI family thioesterase [Streptomyces sp. SID5785]
MAEQPVMTVEETRELLAEYLPDEAGLDVVEVSARGLVFTSRPERLWARPGGTVSGPAIFTFADLSAFVSVSAYVGKVPSAVLTSSSFSFLEAVEPGPLRARIAAARIGRRSAVLTAHVEDEQDLLIAMGTLHFSYPGKRRTG